MEGTAIEHLDHEPTEAELDAIKKGYPQIIAPERFDAIHANLVRRDPVQVSKRQGGRKGDEAFFLRGVAFCRSCGAGLYTRRQAAGRVYMCGNRRQATGLCSAPVIPAELIEGHVLRHLDTFVGSVKTWIAERIAERDSERRVREANLDRQRVHLTILDGQRAKHMTAYSKLVDEGASTAYIALEEVERIDRERVNHRRQIAEIEATVAEWSGPPDVDAALDFYNELVDLMRGRIAEAEGAGDLRRELQRVLAGLWAEIADGQLKAEFALRVIDEPPEDGLRQVLARELGGRRMPFANGLVLGDPVERTRRALQTGTQTSIFSCPPRRRSAPARLGSEGRGHR